MSSEFKPDELVAAIVAKLKLKLGAQCKVKPLAGDDLAENGDLVIVPPAVLVLWVRSRPTVNKDNTRTSYQDVHDVEIWSGDTNLRSQADEATDSLKLVAKVREQVAGARWKLADETLTQPTVLGDTEILQIDRNGTWYTTRIEAPHSAQFSGANAGG